MSSVVSNAVRSYAFRIPSGQIRFTEYFGLSPEDGLMTRRGTFSPEFLSRRVSTTYCGFVTCHQLPPAPTHYTLGFICGLVGYPADQIPICPVKILAAVLRAQGNELFPFCKSGVSQYFILKGPDPDGTLVPHWVKLNFSQGWHLDSGLLDKKTLFEPGARFYYPTPPDH